MILLFRVAVPVPPSWVSRRGGRTWFGRRCYGIKVGPRIAWAGLTPWIRLTASTVRDDEAKGWKAARAKRRAQKARA